MIKIKPGIIVVASVRCTGGVRYIKESLDSEREGATERTRWETTRVIEDVDEWSAATKARATVRNKISAACYHTPFGLLCPQGEEDKLNDAITEARQLAKDFNREARSTRVDAYILKGRVAATDEEAAEAIAAEVRSLLDDMEQGCKAADVEAIRKAASKARNLGQMLEGETGTKVTEAIKAARQVARQVVKRVEKAGEDAEEVLAELSLEPILTARFAVDEALADYSDEESREDALPAVDAQRFTGLEVPDDLSLFGGDDGDAGDGTEAPDLDAFDSQPEEPAAAEAPSLPSAEAILDLQKAAQAVESSQKKEEPKPTPTPNVRAIDLGDLDEEGW
jgi:hypothetical protein